MNIEIKTENIYEKDFKSEIEILDDSDSFDLSEFFLNILQLSKQEAIKLKDIMDNLCISSVEEISQLNDDQWKRISDLVPSKVGLIRDKIETLDKNKTVSLVTNKSNFQLLADWHKVKRGLFYKAKMHQKLKSTGFLDYEALSGAIDEESQNDSFNAGLMLNNIKIFYRIFERY